MKPHPHLVTTVKGPIEPERLGVTDAHNHVWIERPPGVGISAPVLDRYPAILAELREYRRAGGAAIVDCQPGGCGRNGNRLKQLSLESGVELVACTGYHLRKYYPDGYWLFEATPEAASQHFIQELEGNLSECADQDPPVRAGFIKIACEDSLEGSPQRLMDAAVGASLATGAAIQAHTERGQDVEKIVAFLLGIGLAPERLVVSHMDKRPDRVLHASLVQAGVMLEYDTFYREKYHPEENLWPLIEYMVESGLEDGLALATDMAEARLWSHLGGGPGLSGLCSQIIPRLVASGLGEESICKLTGGNITQRLALAKIA